jgi:hypothetical protein
MESHEVLRQALENASPKEIAAELGVSLSLVYKWAQPADDLGSGTVNPLDRVLQIHRICQDDLVIQWLCRKAGGFFVRNPRGGKGDVELTPATHTIVQQFADLLTAISKAAADGKINDQEASAIRREWDELKRYTEGFVSCCENGDYEGIEAISKSMKKS